MKKLLKITLYISAFAILLFVGKCVIVEAWHKEQHRRCVVAKIHCEAYPFDYCDNVKSLCK